MESCFWWLVVTTGGAGEGFGVMKSFTVADLETGIMRPGALGGGPSKLLRLALETASASDDRADDVDTRRSTRKVLSVIVLASSGDFVFIEGVERDSSRKDESMGLEEGRADGTGVKSRRFESSNGWIPNPGELTD